MVSTVQMRDMVAAMDDELQSHTFKDYCPNGLQLQGSTDVAKVVTAVTASQFIIEQAVAAGADMLLVHHGYFWKGEDPTITGMKHKRISTLLRHQLNLVAYHLPLDAHPSLGNNAQLGQRLGVSEVSYLSASDKTIGFKGLFDPVMSAEVLRENLRKLVARDVIHVPVDKPVRSVAWCTGAGQRFIEEAAQAGCDAFISGEISEPTAHIARECGIHYFAAGHHATERYGVQALGNWLAEKYGVEHQFIDEFNPA